MRWVVLFCLLSFSAYAQDLAGDASGEPAIEAWQQEEAPLFDDSAKAEEFTTHMRLQLLNKVTAKNTVLELKVGESLSSSPMAVSAISCWQSPPQQQPEQKALLEVWEDIPGQEKTRIFYGWMFASSPGFAALEHPIYDLILLECYNADNTLDTLQEAPQELAE